MNYHHFVENQYFQMYLLPRNRKKPQRDEIPVCAQTCVTLGFSRILHRGLILPRAKDQKKIAFSADFSRKNFSLTREISRDERDLGCQISSINNPRWRTAEIRVRMISTSHYIPAKLNFQINWRRPPRRAMQLLFRDTCPGVY